MAIKRIWHGWTTQTNAGAYQKLLNEKVFPAIEAKQIPGYRSIELLRCDRGNEVEFVTIMTFDSLQNVIDFQGQDFQRSYVPDAARELLKRYDEISEHYEVQETRIYQ